MLADDFLCDETCAVRQLDQGRQAQVTRAWRTKAELGPEALLLRPVQEWLAHQPAGSLQAMVRSVVAITGAPNYPARVQLDHQAARA